MSSHASFEEEDEIEFKPPALGGGGVEMTLAEQLAAQAEKMR